MVGEGFGLGGIIIGSIRLGFHTVFAVDVHVTAESLSRCEPSFAKYALVGAATAHFVGLFDLLGGCFRVRILVVVVGDMVRVHGRRVWLVTYIEIFEGGRVLERRK